MSIIASQGAPFNVEFSDRSYNGSKKLVFSVAEDPSNPTIPVMRLGALGVALDIVGDVTVNGSTIGAGPATQITETSGPDTLDIDAIADGEFLKRVGNTIVSSAISAPASDAFQTWKSEQLALSATALGVSVSSLSFFGKDFKGEGDYTTNTTGSGTAVLDSTANGTITLSTTATSGRNIIMTSNAAVNAKTEKFSMVCRAKLNVTSYAWGHLMTVCADPAFQEHFFMLVMDGGQLKIEVDGDGGATVPTTWTPETSGYHLFRIDSPGDGTIQAYVDGVSVYDGTNQDILTAALFDGAANFGVYLENEGHSIDEAFTIDKWALITCQS